MNSREQAFSVARCLLACAGVLAGMAGQVSSGHVRG